MKFRALVSESKMLVAVEVMLWRWVKYHEGTGDRPERFETTFVSDWYRDQK